MNKFTYILLSLLLLGCSNERQGFMLQGKIQGLESDTILAFYQLPEYKLDTIVSINGELNYEFEPDTFTVFTLVLNNQMEYPIYADKGKKVEINGHVNDLKIKGEGDNMLFAQILTYLKEIPSPLIQDKVDSIIRKNNQSFTNLYLLDKYFVQDSLPDHKRIEELINSQMGFIKDTPYITNLQKRLRTQEFNYIHTLNSQTREGRIFRWSTIKNKFVLIDFWASWHPQSVAEQDSLIRVIKALRKEDFVVLSVSLDYDREAWLKASDRDTTQWIQLCDFKGWENTLVEEQDITTLPKNLLLNREKRIIERDIRGQKLIDKVKPLLEKTKKKKKK